MNLKPVIDPSGKILDGVFKTPSGSLVVKDPAGVNKYLKEKETEQRLKNLEDKMDLILQLLSNK